MIDRPAPPSRTGLGDWLRAMPRWKKVLLALALLLIATGGVMAIVEASSPAPAVTGNQGSAGTGLQTSLLPNGLPTPGQSPVSRAEEPVSAGLFRVGFSFVAGFCIGFAVRKTLKLAALLTGLLLLCLFLLSYGGLIEVNWHTIDALFTGFMQRVEAESERFRTFVTGSLPAAGLAALGLVAGFKKS